MSPEGASAPRYHGVDRQGARHGRPFPSDGKWGAACILPVQGVVIRVLLMIFFGSALSDQFSAPSRFGVGFYSTFVVADKVEVQRTVRLRTA